jgi:hypothetical protein
MQKNENIFLPRKFRFSPIFSKFDTIDQMQKAFKSCDLKASNNVSSSLYLFRTFFYMI